MTQLFSEYKDIGPEGNQLIDDIKEQAQKLHDLIGRAESVGTAVEEIQMAKNKVIEAVLWAQRGITK
jgi:hypothetical protein